MIEIKKIAVIGSGVMGAGIAAHIANCGFKVLLLDMASNDKADRNIFANNAIKKLTTTNPPAFTIPENANKITAGNLEDDLEKLREIDWIIEVVVEKLEIKQDLYKKIDKFRKKNSIISSNTSTLPLKKLLSPMNEKFKEDFLITHFFNPPRYTKLLELVVGKDTNKQHVKLIRTFLEQKLGKGVVDCKDTPGFIANRIGCFWLEVALNEAIKLGITVEDADSVMGKPMGIPKTAAMGLWDLIGLDLMPLIAKSLLNSLPKTDDFHKIYNFHEFLQKMISEGYTGRKGKGGFYKVTKKDDKTIKEVLDLTASNYILQKGQNAELSNMSFVDIIEQDSLAGKYLLRVLLYSLSYAAKLVPEISNNIVNIDNAMRYGYNWKYGPFELIDMIGSKKFALLLEKENMPVPSLITKLGNNKFYEKGRYFTTRSTYSELKKFKNIITLKDSLGKAILENNDASLIDIGNKVLCFNFKTKMNTASIAALNLLIESIEVAQKKFKGLVIGNDCSNFCVGGNLEYMLSLIKQKEFKKLGNYIELGQQAMMKLKYATIPIVSAHKGLALGGGMETLLHSQFVISEIESQSGLVESKVGLIPAWGGTKEMIIRHNNHNDIARIFMNIVKGNIFIAAKMKEEFSINNQMIIASPDHVIFEAKQKIISYKNDYKNKPASINIDSAKIRSLLEKTLDQAEALTDHDRLIGQKLVTVFCASSSANEVTASEQDLLELELQSFIELAQTQQTAERIENMLKTGKPLRN